MADASSELDIGGGRMFQGALRSDAVSGVVDAYSRYYEGEIEARNARAAALARDYYDLVTDFFEYGWGTSFHFANRFAGETVQASLARHEHYLALRLGLGSTMRALDVGCGVGGPMRSIARFSGAKVVGLNISRYQIERGRIHNRRERLEHLCELAEGDFGRMPFGEDTFDAAYDIEACCHAADRRTPFSEVFRVLKPGALFGGYEWCMTPEFDPADPEHAAIKLGIEKGNGLPGIVGTSEIDRALCDAGFEIEEARDLVLPREAGGVPWYEPLDAALTFTGLKSTRGGAFATHQMLRLLEAVRLSPSGTVKAHDLLRGAQRSLVAGGKRGIFTPMYLFIARKPARA